MVTQRKHVQQLQRTASIKETFIQQKIDKHQIAKKKVALGNSHCREGKTEFGFK